MGTPSSINLAVKANAYYNGSERCCLEDCFDLVDLHVPIVRLSVDSKHSTGYDNEVGAREEMILVGSEDGVRFHL